MECQEALYFLKIIQWINFNNITFNSIFNNIELTIKKFIWKALFQSSACQIIVKNEFYVL